MEWRGQAIFVWCFAQRQMARRSNRLHYFGHICIQWYDATGAWCRASWGRAIAGSAASTQSRWPASPTHRRRVAAMDEHDWRTGAAILANRVPWGGISCPTLTVRMRQPCRLVARHGWRSMCVAGEDIVASFCGLVAGEASLVQRLVAGFAIRKVAESPAARRGV